MRTTVEISDEQHRALLAIARRRGMRGFSPLVREAIDQYLQALRGVGLEEALALEATLTSDEADRLRRRIAEAWEPWRSSS